MIITKKIAVKPADYSIIVEYTDTEIKKRRYRKIYLHDVIVQQIEFKRNHEEIFEKIYTRILEKHHKRYLRNVEENVLKVLVSCLITKVEKEQNSQKILQKDSTDRREDVLEEQFEDLNKVSEEELEKAKSIMDVEFEKNRTKATDLDFKYDIQEEFYPEEPSGWDSS
jgi:hypothetical protein